MRFADLVEIGEDEQMRLVAEGETAQPMRAVHIPVDPQRGRRRRHLPAVRRRSEAGGRSTARNLQALLDVLPIGLALVDRDGRFLTMNQAFRQAAGIKGAAMPVYPGDLVVKEDKARGRRCGPAQRPRPGDVGRPRRSGWRASRPSRSR